ncbi:MAG: protein-L-isoaspartate O-methyltransferase [Pseudomonadota bacterium]
MNFEHARFQMVTQQVRSFDVLDDAVLEVMNQLPREHFVPEAWRDAAYADAGVPIGHGQRTFSPRIDGRILQAVSVQAGDRVLEIGTGSGYLAACMALLGGHVSTLERVGELAEAARNNLRQAGIDRVTVHEAEAPAGLPDERFDVIVLGGAINRGSKALEQLLDLEGRLFVVEGDAPAMTARLVQRAAEDRWYAEDLLETQMPYLVNFEPKPSFKF